MLTFWFCAAALAGAAALLIFARAASALRAAAREGDEDPAQAVYRRQLADLDAQAARGLLAPEELSAARSEAARRLLAAADRRPAREGGGGGRRVARVSTAAAVLAAAGALGLYLLLGRPQTPDQPYAARLARWTTADPASLDPPKMAAVLERIARTRPGDPQVYEYLGRVQLAAGATGEAARAFARAARLTPADADFPAQEGEALTMGAGGKVEPPAEAAFREALRRDPRNEAARFYLGRWRMAQGDVAGGLAQWRALAADLPPADPRRGALEQEIAAASAPVGVPPSGGPSAAQVAAAAGAMGPGGADQAAFIRGMVGRLAARLQAQPDDVDGWARLVRAYKVLGDHPAEDRALARARTLYARRPADLARIEAER